MLAGRDVDLDRDLEELQILPVQARDPLRDVVQPDVADPRIPQFLEHLRLLLKTALLGIMPVNAEREEDRALRWLRRGRALGPKPPAHAHQRHCGQDANPLPVCFHVATSNSGYHGRSRFRARPSASAHNRASSAISKSNIPASTKSAPCRQAYRKALSAGMAPAAMTL